MSAVATVTPTSIDGWADDVAEALFVIHDWQDAFTTADMLPVEFTTKLYQRGEAVHYRSTISRRKEVLQ